MKGVAEAHAAVTIVNALPTGIGCAIGISIPVTASVALEPLEGHAPGRVEIDPPSDTPLVREALREAIGRAAPGSSWNGSVQVDSGIPASRGLKSSSAVAAAVVGATLRALGRSADPVELARISARVGRNVGLSATGAFDDALAGLTSGFVITDNREEVILRSAPVDPALRVALLIPPTAHTPSPAWKSAFERRAAESRAALEHAVGGRWGLACEANSALVEEVMGYDYRALRARLLERGAIACGVSGLGPTLAALVDRQYADEVFAELPPDLGERRLVAVAAGERVAAPEGE
jgi:shikimate kinase